MADPIQQVKDAMMRDMHQLDVISQNIANVNTPGYRALQPIATPFNDLVTDPAHSRAQSLTLPTLVKNAPGNLVKTGRALDVGIQGQGFLQLQAGSQIYLTRAGSLQLNAEGLLVGANGYPVVGQSGNIQLKGSDVRIESSGAIYEDGQLIDHLALVAVADPQALRHLGTGVYAYHPQDFTPVDSPNLQQGHVESSNVNSSESMIQLIQLQRHIESTQKALQAYGQIMNAGVNELGK
ncbi:MAG: flagellar hook basal-body protein [Pseudomonadota bacterium]